LFKSFDIAPHLSVRQNRFRSLQFMPHSFDAYMPRTRFQFPEGAAMSIGTIRCDDEIHQAVYLSYTPVGSTTPSMELELPPKTVEVIIRHLQERANEARFVNGERMLEYPEPYPVKPFGPVKKTRRRKKTGNKPEWPEG
jgi:hypothetical protein